MGILNASLTPHTGNGGSIFIDPCAEHYVDTGSIGLHSREGNQIKSTRDWSFSLGLSSSMRRSISQRSPVVAGRHRLDPRSAERRESSAVAVVGEGGRDGGISIFFPYPPLFCFSPNLFHFFPNLCRCIFKLSFYVKTSITVFNRCKEITDSWTFYSTGVRNVQGKKKKKKKEGEP